MKLRSCSEKIERKKRLLLAERESEALQPVAHGGDVHMVGEAVVDMAGGLA